MKRYRAWRNWLTSEVAHLGGLYWRVISRRGKIVAIEQWTPFGPDLEYSYNYTVWKETGL